MASSAWAGPALDDAAAQPGAAATDPSVAANPPEDPEKKVEYGLGVRLRNVRAPKAVIELFVDRSAGGASNAGFGVELIRRRGNTELQLGFEFEHISVGEGVWIAKGDNVATGDEADYVVDSSLGWFTIDFTFLNHAVINKYVSVRYGVGAGIGILTGTLDHYNIICAGGTTNNNPEPGCKAPPPVTSDGTGSYSEGTQTLVHYGLPPVFPVLNGIIGVQFKPMEKLTINIEGGIRTLPFFGISAAYFL
ncbi:MAG: hypothetical protein ABI175_21150 [Polyangiales bacterium]